MFRAESFVWEFNLRDIFRWCELMKKYQVRKLMGVIGGMCVFEIVCVCVWFKLESIISCLSFNNIKCITNCCGIILTLL